MKIFLITAALGAVLVAPALAQQPPQSQTRQGWDYGCTSTRRIITCRNTATATPTQISSSLGSDNRNGSTRHSRRTSAEQRPSAAGRLGLMLRNISCL